MRKNLYMSCKKIILKSWLEKFMRKSYEYHKKCAEKLSSNSYVEKISSVSCLEKLKSYTYK